LTKTRHQVPLGGDIVEVDVYGGRLSGLIVAEVEFDALDAAQGFTPPEWFATEVTEDAAWSNAQLAQAFELPHPP
jgi:CYTH domain-containing protein